MSLLSAAQIAARMDVTRQRVYQLVDTDPRFPAPVPGQYRMRLWNSAEISRYIELRKLRPHRLTAAAETVYDMLAQATTDDDGSDYARGVIAGLRSAVLALTANPGH